MRSMASEKVGCKRTHTRAVRIETGTGMQTIEAELILYAWWSRCGLFSGAFGVQSYIPSDGRMIDE
jgi:hypothetical protein